MNDLFQTEGDILRDRGIALVMENAGPDWKDRAVAFVRHLPRGWCGTGEDIRLLLENQNIRPHSPHAWGGLIASLVKGRTRLLVRTGERRKMRHPRSHSRQTDVYERC